MRWLWRYSAVGYYAVALLIAAVGWLTLTRCTFDLREPAFNPIRARLGEADVLGIRRDGRTDGIECLLVDTRSMGFLYPDGERVLVVRGVVYAERELRPENHRPTLSRQEFNWLWARCTPDPHG